MAPREESISRPPEALAQLPIEKVVLSKIQVQDAVSLLTDEPLTAGTSVLRTPSTSETDRVVPSISNLKGRRKSRQRTLLTLATFRRFCSFWVPIDQWRPIGPSVIINQHTVTLGTYRTLGRGNPYSEIPACEYSTAEVRGTGTSHW